MVKPRGGGGGGGGWSPARGSGPVGHTEGRFEARLDGALSRLVWWKGFLPRAAGLELGDRSGSSQPKPSCDSTTLWLRFRDAAN